MTFYHLKFHTERCETCRYYRIHQYMSSCLNLGRDLSSINVPYADKARYCDLWKKRPKIWTVVQAQNPYWHDSHISRETQLKLPGRRTEKK